MRFALITILVLFFSCSFCYISIANETTITKPTIETTNNNTNIIKEKSAIKKDFPNQALVELIQQLAGIQSMKAEFIQQSIGSAKKSKAETGIFLFKRPDCLAWKTTSPYKQEIFANSSKTITVDPDFKQVVIHTTNLDALYFYLFNADAKKIDQLYSVSTSVKSKEILYHLIPKQKNELFEKIDLVFTKNKLNRIQWEDSLGKNVVINLNKVQTNLSLKDNLFTVDIKKLENSGYDIADYQDKKANQNKQVN